MRLTVTWLWKWRIKFWSASVIQAFSYKREKVSYRIISSSQIDRQKWNHAIETNCALIFNRFEYLSAVCNWDAVVNDNYSLLLPLPFRRKFGLKYYTTAPFTHRLQLIGKANEEEKRKLLKIVKAKSFAALVYVHSEENINQISKTNYILKLDRPFNALNKSFAFSFRSEVKHASKHEMFYSDGIVEDVIQSGKNKYEGAGISANAIDKFAAVCKTLSSQNMCICKTVFDSNETLAAVILFKDAHRIYNVFNYVSEKGRIHSANYKLYHEVLKEFSETDYVFDFVGSELKGVQQFYLKFRPETEYYHLLSMGFLNRFRKIYQAGKRRFSAV